MMTEFFDHKGRAILKFDFNGNALFGRHKDMLEEDKQLLLDFSEMCDGIDREDLRDFLDFKREDFCS
jgi:hypothetical protein